MVKGTIHDGSEDNKMVSNETRMLTINLGSSGDLCRRGVRPRHAANKQRSVAGDGDDERGALLINSNTTSWRTQRDTSWTQACDTVAGQQSAMRDNPGKIWIIANINYLLSVRSARRGSLTGQSAQSPECTRVGVVIM